jgi:hypothetical protein
MSRFLHFIEALLLPLIAIISFIVSVGEFFNIFHLVSPGDIPILTFLLISTALGSLCFIQNKCNEIHRDLQRLLSRIELEQMKETIAQIHPNLLRVLGDEYFLDLVHFFHIVVNENKVQVNDFDRFSFYFKHTLQAYPGVTFLLTSSLTTPYLWNNTEIEDALTNFICSGGRIKQIFFVRDPAELSFQDTQTMLTHQRRMGIEVHVVNSTFVPGNFKQYFFVEEGKKIAWELPVDHAGHVGSSIITANEQTTGNYYATFEKLWNNALNLNKIP